MKPRLMPPAVHPIIPPSNVPGERQQTWESLLGKPTTIPGAGIAITLSDIPANASATRKFLQSHSAAAPIWDTVQLADLPTNATATRKFLRSVSSGAAVWDVLTAADIGAGTFPVGVFTFQDEVDITVAAGANAKAVLSTPTSGKGALLGFSTPDRVWFEGTNIATTGGKWQLYDATAALLRLEYDVASGFAIRDGFGCNSKSAQAAFSVGAAAVDLATVLVLANNIRTALIANGIAS